MEEVIVDLNKQILILYTKLKSAKESREILRKFKVLVETIKIAI